MLIKYFKNIVLVVSQHSVCRVKKVNDVIVTKTKK